MKIEKLVEFYVENLNSTVKKNYDSNYEYQLNLVLAKGYTSLRDYHEHLAEERQTRCENKLFSKFLNHLLKKHGKGKAWLANEINVSRQMIYNYCSGKNLPTEEKAEAIAKSFRIKYEVLEEIIFN